MKSLSRQIDLIESITLHRMIEPDLSSCHVKAWGVINYAGTLFVVRILFLISFIMFYPQCSTIMDVCCMICSLHHLYFSICMVIVLPSKTNIFWWRNLYHVWDVVAWYTYARRIMLPTVYTISQCISTFNYIHHISTRLNVVFCFTLLWSLF